MTEKTWTVARFPDGSWTWGGPADSPDYALCDVWSIVAPTAKIAVSRARGRYYRTRKASEPESGKDA